MKKIILLLLVPILTLSAKIVETQSEALVTKGGLSFLFGEKEPFEGVVIMRDMNNTITYLSEYRSGKRHGKFTTFDRVGKSGKKVREELFVEGELILKITYHKNGVIREELPIQDGKASGYSATYYKFGKIKALTLWKDGKQSGEPQHFKE